MTATKKRILLTQADVVEALGGPRAFERRFHLSRTAPYNYVSGVPWPLRLHCAVIAVCAKEGLTLGRDLLDRLPLDTLVGIAAYVANHNIGQEYGKDK